LLAGDWDVGWNTMNDEMDRTMTREVPQAIAASPAPSAGGVDAVSR
jgi:hypothetical protein